MTSNNTNTAFNNSFYSIETAPKGSLVLLLVKADTSLVASADQGMYCPTEDTVTGLYRTVGLLDNVPGSEWSYAGYHYNSNDFIEGVGEVVGWLPLPSAEEFKQDLSLAPKDGSLVMLLVTSGGACNNPTEDTEYYRTVGFNLLENDDDQIDEWCFAGCTWYLDEDNEFTTGNGEVIGWLPLPNAVLAA